MCIGTHMYIHTFLRFILYVILALTVPELTPDQAQRYILLCPQSLGIKNMPHHCPARPYY